MTHALLVSEPKFGVRPVSVVTGKPGHYRKHAEDYVSRFFKLVRQWRAETAYTSSATELYDHPAFAEIVRMGKITIPLIISELRRQPDALLGALPRITGENPVASSDRGDIYAMATSWIDWYQRRRR